jgi:cell shape-determining protein MreD
MELNIVYLFAILSSFSLSIFITLVLSKRLKSKPHWIRASAEVFSTLLTGICIFALFTILLKVDGLVFLYYAMLSGYLILAACLTLCFVKIRKQMKTKKISFLEWLKSGF